MKFPPHIPTYGNPKFRGKCPIEDIEQISFLNKLRKEHPDTWGALAVHIRNEGLVRGGQFSAVIKHKAMGQVAGASDIVIPGSPAFVCEMKRQNPQLSKWQDGQKEYLERAADMGAFACVALGAAAAWDAFEDYLRIYYGKK
jgi:Flp pilus assembly secretin CpaC